MPLIDIIDETFVVAASTKIAAEVHDTAFWSQLWPGLTLTLAEDRAGEGIRWACAGTLVGTAEVWLETSGDGVIVHCYLRVDPPADWSARRIRRESRRRQLELKRVTFALKDRLEGDRPPGEGRLSVGGDLPTSKT